MDITVLIWVAIIILWSVKTASDQKKRTQRQERQADDTDERVAPPVEMEPRPARHARRPAEQEARRDARVEEAASEPLVLEAVSLETFDDEASAADTIPAPIATHDVRQETPEEKRPTCPAATDGPLGEPFDLRRAVIYSEILKPKFEE